MSYDQAAMAAFAQQVVADCNGRMVTPTGESLNVDGRYGWQCMDLFIYIRYHLGFRDNLPTPDAASVWEMNWTHPDSTMWTVFDGITPDKPCYPGDIGIMNRQFFDNGVGHIFMIVADLGTSIRVLELNGLGDGSEDDNGNQYGSPARIHDWPKTYLYGYLRWIGPAPTLSAQSDTITPIQEDFMATLSDAEKQVLMDAAARINGFLVQRYDGNKQPARALDTLDGNQIRADIAASTARAVAETSSAFHQLQPGLIAIAAAVGSIKNQPSAAAPAIDVPALAAQIATALNATQAHDFLVAFRNALPAQ